MESVDFGELVNHKDKYGNTVLHLAVADKQVETTEFLVSTPRIDLNAVNHSGITAMEILIQRRRDSRDVEMEESLKQAGAIQGKKKSYFCNDKQKAKKKGAIKNQSDWVDRKKSAVMVVASLIATMAFQAGVNPADDFWKMSSSPTQVFPDNGEDFYILNTVGLIMSLSIILLLMSGLPLNNIFLMWILLVATWVAISCVALSYAMAVVILAPLSKQKDIYDMVGYTILAWLGVISLLMLCHTLRLSLIMLKMIFKMLKLVFRCIFVGTRNSADTSLV